MAYYDRATAEALQRIANASERQAKLAELRYLEDAFSSADLPEGKEPQLQEAVLKYKQYLWPRIYS